MSKSILVIDDSVTMRSLIRRALQGAGFDVVEACDGIQGAEMLGRDDVSVAICDVNMPRMNGVEMLESLQPDGLNVPVLMLTTERRPDLMKRARDAGAKGWVIKPFDADQLIAAVRKLAEN